MLHCIAVRCFDDADEGGIRSTCLHQTIIRLHCIRRGLEELDTQLIANQSYIMRRQTGYWTIIRLRSSVYKRKELSIYVMSSVSTSSQSSSYVIALKKRHVRFVHNNIILLHSGNAYAFSRLPHILQLILAETQALHYSYFTLLIGSRCLSLSTLSYLSKVKTSSQMEFWMCLVMMNWRSRLGRVR